MIHDLASSRYSSRFLCFFSSLDAVVLSLFFRLFHVLCLNRKSKAVLSLGFLSSSSPLFCLVLSLLFSLLLIHEYSADVAVASSFFASNLRRLRRTLFSLFLSHKLRYSFATPCLARRVRLWVPGIFMIAHGMQPTHD